MSIPLLAYKPTTQNHRVAGYDVGTDETPTVYRTESLSDGGSVDELIWAAYRQVYSEHEILAGHRQGDLESQLRNNMISVREFVRGLGKSQPFYYLVVETNSNYRVVEIALKRFLGRKPFNQQETIAWSIVIAQKGVGGLIDALVDSDEYQSNFGDRIVPFQRRRMKERPFNLVTPRYSDYWRTKLETDYPKAGDIRNFLDLAKQLSPSGITFKPVSTANIAIPDSTRKTVSPQSTSIRTAFKFPVR